MSTDDLDDGSLSSSERAVGQELQDDGCIHAGTAS